MRTTILILIDGLGAYACPHMGWLAAMTEAGKARYSRLSCALPPLSRPLYHCILAGQKPVESGIVTNDTPRPATPCASVFHRVREARGVTAAAAYHWVSELYNTAPFDAALHRWTSEPALPIQHGIFYNDDAYPDSHVFWDAATLRRRFAPDFLLVHTMGVDNAGHLHGGDSPAYRDAVRGVDALLAEHVPAWLAEGCAVFVTSDHGMHSDGMHNDTTDAVRHVPVWALGTAAPLPAAQERWPDTLYAALELQTSAGRSTP